MQFLKKLFVGFGVVALMLPAIGMAQTIAPTTPIAPQPPIAIDRTIRGDGNDIVQFNNLEIGSVSLYSDDRIAEITVRNLEVLPMSGSVSGGNTSAQSQTLCKKFNSPAGGASIEIACPQPAPTTGYRISVLKDTILLFRTRSAASIGDFAAGDRINVFGYYNPDGTVRALIVRNVSKPVERQFIQLNNMEVRDMLKTNPPTLMLVQYGNDPCQRFEGDKKINMPCPLMGAASAPSVSASVGSQPRTPEGLIRKYDVRLTERTIILDKNRTKLTAADIRVGDKINVYGSYTDLNSQAIEAEIVRVLSVPRGSGDVDQTKDRIDGTVERLNAGDGTVLVRMRDGSLVTVENPFRVGTFVSIRGTLKDGNVSDITDVSVRAHDDPKAPPALSQMVPGSGQIGTRITLTGSGFTRANNINFGNVARAIQGVASPDGKTLSFTVPATPCAPDMMCAQVVLQPGEYPVSVSNENGSSNTLTFRVTELPAFSISTESIPQAMQNEKYEFSIQGQGGIDSYTWSVTRGSLPPGLTLTSAVCITAPCKTPGTLWGTPTTPGVYEFTLSLQSGKEAAQRSYRMVVVQALNPAILR